MTQPPLDADGKNPQASASFGNIPKDSETFGTVPHVSAEFGSIPNPPDKFGGAREMPERKENHTLTVRDCARMFEAAGVSRTERSIINWCQPNRMGVARLDSYFDPNERKYFITQQSVELAIAEEMAKATKSAHDISEPADAVPKVSESRSDVSPTNRDSVDDPERMKSMEQELMNLKILNGGKDFLIQQLREERNGFIQQTIDGSRKIGELEARLLQLEGPSDRRGSFNSESFGKGAEIAKQD